MTQQPESLQSYLDCETVTSMKETLCDSFAHLAHYHFASTGDDQEPFNTILGTLSDFHQVLTIAKNQPRL